MMPVIPAMLALILLPTASVPAEDWQILTEADNDVVFWIDRASIREVGSYKQARTKSDYSKVTWGDVSARIATEDYDCAQHALRTRATIAYGRDGNVLRTLSLAEGEAEWKVVTPGSIAEAKIEAVCGAPS